MDAQDAKMKPADTLPEYDDSSDDDALKFGEEDDLYSSGADDEDARWVRKQVNP